MTEVYIDKRILLQNWEEICLQVKKGLQRLGHDILLAPKYKDEKGNKEFQQKDGGKRND